jgi:hypothetical protein
MTEKLRELLPENPRGRLSRKDELSGRGRIHKAPSLPRRYYIFPDEESGE